MRRIAAALAVVLLVGANTAAQQTALTDAQITSAGAEVPQLMELLELKPGMTVGDVGAGFGAWTMRFARELGPTGRVYATDIGAAQLAALRDVTQRERLNNVTVIEGAVNATNLPALCCDAILIRDAYHHLTQPQAFIRSLAASLKPGGRLVYSTCSVEREENEDVIHDFLSTHTDFTVQKTVRTWPHREGSDGFFVAVLERRRS